MKTLSTVAAATCGVAIAGFTVTGFAHAQASDGGMISTLVPGTACNATFAISDSDNDGTITRSEFETWNDVGFKSLDADGDGQLSREEFVDCMRIDTGEDEITTEQSAQYMEAADVDASGSVSAEEYMSAANAAHRQAAEGVGDGIMILRRFILVPSGVSDEDMGMMTESQVAASAAGKFRTLDADSNREITKDEIDKAGWDNMNAWLNLDFDEMDSDGDGAISRSEYDHYANRRWDSSMTAAESAEGTAQDGSGSDRVPTIYYYYFTPAPRP
ncbi:EF-hand domain-containing protein [Defluviimonas sp. WL0002]|uniref:EF-hand domain-containing protein n=1 Tax=Albidovulum marisflavi TaxID=2984159 RepID=A0ABT2ZCK3_9RHOB|nr:EF-hand domain-containing protein [Defluviimonas sp. WL0002]MCV2868859.1 EF-hand domain-containing protein [Defluviimonas sp. WL0002]